MVYIMQMLQPSGAAVRRRSNSAFRAVDWPDRDKKWLRPKDPDLKYYEKYTLSNGAPWIATVPGLTGGLR